MQPVKRVVGNLFGREDAIRKEECLVCKAKCPIEVRCNWPNTTQDEYAVCGLCWKCQRAAFDEPSECTCATPCCEADIGIGIINCGSQHCPIHGVSEGV